MNTILLGEAGLNASRKLWTSRISELEIVCKDDEVDAKHDEPIASQAEIALNAILGRSF